MYGKQQNKSLERLTFLSLPAQLDPTPFHRSPHVCAGSRYLTGANQIQKVQDYTPSLDTGGTSQIGMHQMHYMRRDAR
jgi:hypothetical protein